MPHGRRTVHRTASGRGTAGGHELIAGGPVAALRRLRRSGPIALEAALAVTIAQIAVRVLPRGLTTRLLGEPVEETRDPVSAGRADARARRVGRVVERVSALLPWHPVCLPQAIATRWLLRRRRIPCLTHLGVTATKPLETHAWVTVAGSVVQGRRPVAPPELARFR